MGATLPIFITELTTARVQYIYAIDVAAGCGAQCVYDLWSCVDVHSDCHTCVRMYVHTKCIQMQFTVLSYMCVGVN